MADTVAKDTYTLLFPITREIRAADGTIREEEIRPAGHVFRLRRAKARHIEEMGKVKGEIEQGFWLIAHVTGLTIDEVRDMDSADLHHLQEYLEVFMTGGPAIGAAA